MPRTVAPPPSMNMGIQRAIKRIRRELRGAWDNEMRNQWEYMSVHADRRQDGMVPSAWGVCTVCAMVKGVVCSVHGCWLHSVTATTRGFIYFWDLFATWPYIQNMHFSCRASSYSLHMSCRSLFFSYEIDTLNYTLSLQSGWRDSKTKKNTCKEHLIKKPDKHFYITWLIVNHPHFKYLMYSSCH